jgi:hypothetical protein
MGMDLNDIEEYGNVDNPGEDAENADNEMFNEKENENMNEKININDEPPNWVHPDLSIENDDDMIVKLNQDDIDYYEMSEFSPKILEEYQHLYLYNFF